MLDGRKLPQHHPIYMVVAPLWNPVGLGKNHLAEHAGDRTLCGKPLTSNWWVQDKGWWKDGTQRAMPIEEVTCKRCRRRGNL